MFSYWGKSSLSSESPVHLLPYHLWDVAAVGESLLRLNVEWERSLSETLGLLQETTRSLLIFLLAIHDIGKFSGSFQMRNPALVQQLGRRVRSYRDYHHTLTGQSFWRSHLRGLVAQKEFLGPVQRGEAPREAMANFDALVSATLAHHGEPVEAANITYRKVFNADEEAATMELVIAARRLAWPNETTLSCDDWEALRTNGYRASWMVAGFVILCDWIGSDQKYFPPVDHAPSDGDLSQYWSAARKHATDAVKNAGVVRSTPADDPTFATLYPEFIPTPLQAELSGLSLPNEPGLYLIEDLTGSGKTEAAMTLAARLISGGRADGLYTALPTMATANGLYDRLADSYRRFFSNDSSPSLILAHGARNMATCFKDSIVSTTGVTGRNGQEGPSVEAECAAWIADRRKATFWADIGVGTIDQALMAALPLRHQSLRLAGLARKVLIIDEAHAYDPYVNGLLQELLRFHGALGGSAIVLSATLPAIRKQKLTAAFFNTKESRPIAASDVPYPLITLASRSIPEPIQIPLTSRRQRWIATRFIEDEADVYSLLKETAVQGGCALWIRNTVQDAIDGWRALITRNEIPHRPVLFHARFAMGDRLAIEREVMEAFGPKGGESERAGKVVVATQVVEQSLDLDFDLVISDLAPMDLLIQRAGRLCRHPRDTNGNKLSAGADKRGTPIFYILSPDPRDEVESDWYKRLFPKAAYVYPSHGRLWLTARLFKDQGGWREPEDMRYLIESVYGDGEELPVPKALEDRDFRVEGEEHAEASCAKNASLNLDDGYLPSHGGWRAETPVTKTRLGESTTTLRLARWDGRKLTPWSEEENHPWERSQLSIPSRLLASLSTDENHHLRSAIKDVNLLAPGGGKWAMLLPLQQDKHGRWGATGMDSKERVVTIEYNKELGFISKVKESDNDV